MEFNVLQCRRFVVPSATRSAGRTVANYEIDFHVSGGRTVVIDGVSHDIPDGSICIRKPGQVAYGVGDFDCYLLTLDFSKTTPTENYLRNAPLTVEPLTENPLIDALPAVFVPRHRGEVHALFADLANRPILNAPDSHLLVNELLCLLNADAYRQQYTDKQRAASPAETAAAYVRARFNESVSLDEIASAVHLDKAYLVRLFKKQYGVTPIEYLITQRIHHAGMLLANTTLSVEEIATECGYSTASFFVRQFKQHVHTTPHRYRAEQRGNHTVKE